jgi:hypothetical protein
MGQLGFFDSGLLETILLARAVGYDLLMLDGKYIAAGSSPRSLMWPERQCRKSHRFAASRLSVTLLILSIACDAESHLAVRIGNLIGPANAVRKSTHWCGAMPIEPGSSLLNIFNDLSADRRRELRRMQHAINGRW